jgi:hypothetical protein
MVPESGLSRPADNPNKVVLPLPEGPTIAKASPSSTAKEISSRTVRDPDPLEYDFLRLLTFNIFAIPLRLVVFWYKGGNYKNDFEFNPLLHENRVKVLLSVYLLCILFLRRYAK